MHIYRKIYEFAASAGAFEGFVYGRKETEPDDFSNWVNNMVAAYGHLPPNVRKEIQTSLDETLGRAIRSLMLLLSEDQELIQKIKSMLIGPIPESPDDFRMKKWFHRG